MTRTRIVCTLGPASESDEVLAALIEAGMAFARLNFSHGRPEEHRRRAESVRRLAAQIGRSVQLIQDLQGPKIRTVHTPPTELRKGQEVYLSGQPLGDALVISEPLVLEAIQPGQRVYIDDGLIELEAIDRQENVVRCRVEIGGTIEGNQGVVFPQLSISLPALTDRDLEDIAIGRAMGVEWVALSFVQKHEDILRARDLVAPGVGMIAKIETPAALEDLADIVAVSDAVMIARGDLGVTIPRARVPIVQKDIVRAARQQRVASIVATEMLRSMVERAHPTRAEAADVANAVLDGCSAVMLSEETAVGAYPVQAVAEMQRIIETAEGSAYYVWGDEEVRLFSPSGWGPS